MTTGRKIFSRYEFIINFFVLVFKLHPKFLRILYWDIISRYSQLPFIALRYALFKSLAGKCGINVRLGKNITILSWQNFVVGNNVSIHDNCYIDASGEIKIGNDVSIAHNSTILSSNHDWNDVELPIKYNPIIFKSVNIADNVWIGCGCRILAGVKIFERSIIAAGGVVNKNVEPNSIYGGVPAKLIKHL